MKCHNFNLHNIESQQRDQIKRDGFLRSIKGWIEFGDRIFEAKEIVDKIPKL